MANGVIDFNMSQSSGSYILGRIIWNSSTNIQSNSSEVTASIWVKKGHTSSTLTVPTTGTWTYSIKINDSNFSGSYRTSVLNDYVQLDTATVTVAHDSDGNKSFIISGSVSGPAGSSFAGHTSNGAGAAYMDTIPRASSISAVSWATIGSALNISITRASSAFTHTLTYSFAGTSGTITTKTSATNVTWTPAMSLCNRIPNDEYASCTITCTTYSGSTQIGNSTTFSLYLTVPAYVELSCSSGWAGVTYYNTGTAAQNIAAFVKGYSKAQVSFNAAKISTSGSYGATIASYKIIFNGASYSSPYRTPTINSAGQMSVTAYVYDTRGRSVSTTLSFTVQDYSVPALSSISVYRCTSNGTASDDGTYIYVKANTTYSSIGGLNSTILRARYKTTEGSYGNYYTLTSNTGAILGEGTILVTASYMLEITATDTLGNTTVFTEYVPTASVAFNVRDGGNGVAFGKYCEHDKALELPEDWTFYYQGESLLSLLLNYVYPVGSLYISQNATDPAFLFGGEWERCCAGRALFGENGSDPDFTSPGKTGGYKTHYHELPFGPNDGTNMTKLPWNYTADFGADDSSPNTYALNGSAQGDAYTFKRAKTYWESNLPPYECYYIWKRIA